MDSLTLSNGRAVLDVLKVPTNEEIERAEWELRHIERRDCPLKHLFAPGIYIREIFMPANTFVIGHEHTTEHFNIVLKGSAWVMINGELQHIEAPFTLVSKPGVRKVLLIEEDMIWQTVHANPYDERHIPTLEADHVIKSGSHERHLEDLAKLKLLVNPDHEP